MQTNQPTVRNVSLIPWIRLSISIAMGSVVTGFLLIALIALIDHKPYARAASAPIRTLDFIRVNKESPVIETNQTVRPPPSPQPPPQGIRPVDVADIELNVVDQIGLNLNPSSDIDAIDFGSDLEFSPQMGFSATDGDYIPLVKIQPIYPRKALRKGIEGSIVLEFTITKSGATKDVRIIRSRPRGVFNEAALEAARKFRYRPRTINGEPVEVQGVQNELRFKIPKKRR